MPSWSKTSIIIPSVGQGREAAGGARPEQAAQLRPVVLEREIAMPHRILLPPGNLAADLQRARPLSDDLVGTVNDGADGVNLLRLRCKVGSAVSGSGSLLSGRVSRGDRRLALGRREVSPVPCCDGCGRGGRLRYLALLRGPGAVADRSRTAPSSWLPVVRHALHCSTIMLDLTCNPAGSVRHW
jgi:hypothetical protein